MAWSKQGAFAMLVAVVFWTAAPLLACTPVFGHQAKSDCCVTMQDCGSMVMSGSCCELAPTHHPATTVTAYAPEHDRQTAAIAREAFLPVFTGSDPVRQSFQATTFPDPSPGQFSVLRI